MTETISDKTNRFSLAAILGLVLGLPIGIILGMIIPTTQDCTRLTDHVRDQVELCRPCPGGATREQCIQDHWKPLYIMEHCVR